jgi:hypothetical protein
VCGGAAARIERDALAILIVFGQRVCGRVINAHKKRVGSDVIVLAKEIDLRCNVVFHKLSRKMLRSDRHHTHNSILLHLTCKIKPKSANLYNKGIVICKLLAGTHPKRSF